MTAHRGAAPDADTGADAPAVSLIVPTRNRPGMLADTVASILEGDTVPAELVIVDQSDVRHTAFADADCARGCEIRYLWSPDRGLSRARNRGIAQARHDILAFTDDDVRVDRAWLATLVRALVGAGPDSIVTGRVPPADEREGGFVPSTRIDTTPAVYQGRIGADVLYPHNMAMRRALLDAVGDFDVRLGAGTRFGGSEDNDFAFRALEAGFRIVYVPDAIVHHRAWRPMSAYLALRWRYGRGQGAFYAKHSSIRDRYMVWRLAHELGQRGARSVRLLARSPRRAAGQVICALGVLSGFGEWLITRPKS